MCATLVVRVSQEPSTVKWSEFLFVLFETNARKKMVSESSKVLSLWFLTLAIPAQHVLIVAIPAQHGCLFWQRVLLTCVKLSDT
jgi:hypothetical protein